MAFQTNCYTQILGNKRRSHLTSVARLVVGELGKLSYLYRRLAIGVDEFVRHIQIVVFGFRSNELYEDEVHTLQDIWTARRCEREVLLLLLHLSLS